MSGTIGDIEWKDDIEQTTIYFRQTYVWILTSLILHHHTR